MSCPFLKKQLTLKTIAILVFFVAAGVTCQAQGLKWIEGSIWCPETEQLVQAATIQLYQGNNVLFQTTTDEYGRYEFGSRGQGLIPPGDYRIKAHKSNYFTMWSDVSVHATHECEYCSLPLSSHSSADVAITFGPAGVLEFRPFGDTNILLYVPPAIPEFTETYTFFGKRHSAASTGDHYFEYDDVDQGITEYDVLSADFLILDSNGDEISSFSEVIWIGFGDQFDLNFVPLPIKQFSSTITVLYHYDEATGEWHQHPKESTKQRVYKLDVLFETSHLSKWKAKKKPKLLQSSIIDPEPGQKKKKLMVWLRSSEDYVEGDVLSVVEIENGIPSGSISRNHKHSCGGMFANSSSLASEIGVSIGVDTVVGWATSINGNTKGEKTSSSSVNYLTEFEERIEAPPKGIQIPPDYDGEIQIVEVGYECWIHWELYEYDPLKALSQGDTYPIFIPTGSETKWVPPID